MRISGTEPYKWRHIGVQADWEEVGPTVGLPIAHIKY